MDKKGEIRWVRTFAGDSIKDYIKMYIKKSRETGITYKFEANGSIFTVEPGRSILAVQKIYQDGLKVKDDATQWGESKLGEQESSTIEFIVPFSKRGSNWQLRQFFNDEIYNWERQNGGRNDNVTFQFVTQDRDGSGHAYIVTSSQHHVNDAERPKSEPELKLEPDER